MSAAVVALGLAVLAMVSESECKSTKDFVDFHGACVRDQR